MEFNDRTKPCAIEVKQMSLSINYSFLACKFSWDWLYPLLPCVQGKLLDMNRWLFSCTGSY